LLVAARVPDIDAGFVLLASGKDAEAFVETCRQLRFWQREMAVDLDAASLAAPKSK
jgi:catalase